MTRWPAYPAYKPSGLPWLGDIPAHWQARRLKFVAPASTIKLAEKPTDSIYIGLEQIESGTGRLLLDTPVEQVDSAVGVFYKGDVLFGKLRPYLAKVVWAEFDGVCTSELLTLQPIPEADGKFLFYLLLSDGFISLVNSMTYGTKMPRASSEQIGNISAPLPPLPEQRAIAAFLDRETALLDALIAKKERLIELLGEKRAALISQAVTRGLDPTVPMKDSGVPWLGQVPKHWETKRLKHIATLKSGESITAEQITANNEIPVYGGNGLRGYTDSYTHDGHFVLIGRQGALCGNINYARGKFWASEHAVVVTPVIPVATIWLGELLRTMNLNQYSISAAQPGLAVDRINQLPIPFPPLEEQRTIATHLDRETAKLDDLIAKVREGMEKLREYRAALIAAAVTGKIDVRATSGP